MLRLHTLTEEDKEELEFLEFQMRNADAVGGFGDEESRERTDRFFQEQIEGILQYGIKGYEENRRFMVKKRNEALNDKATYDFVLSYLSPELIKEMYFSLKEKGLIK